MASQRHKPAVMEQTLKPTLTIASPAPVRARWLVLWLVLVGWLVGVLLWLTSEGFRWLGVTVFPWLMVLLVNLVL